MDNFPCVLLGGRPTPFRRIRGVVLPIVLVVLTVLTGLVVTQVRRSALDERLAANTRESVQLDSAVQTVLRWCELKLTVAPRNTVALPLDPNAAVNPPPWRVAVNWATDTNSLNFTGTAAQLGLPNTNLNPACVIEDVTCDLIPAISYTGLPGESYCAGKGELDPRWRKFRITARVSTPAPDLGGGNRFVFSQSELRLYIE